MTEKREIEQLNWLGRAVYLAGQGVRLTADLIDSVVEVAAEAYVEVERAFKQGLDPQIDDATILEERTHEETKPETN